MVAACIVTTSADNTARIWQLSDGSWRFRTLTGHTGMVMSAAVSPDGKLIVTASSDYTARVWRLSDGEYRRTLLNGEYTSNGRQTSHLACVSSVAMTPDGRHVVTASHDKTARVWKLTDDDTGDACRAGGEEGGGEEGGGKEGGGEKRSSEHDEESGDENEHEEAMRPARTHNPYGISSLFGLEIRVSISVLVKRRIQHSSTRCGPCLCSCSYGVWRVS